MNIRILAVIFYLISAVLHNKALAQEDMTHASPGKNDAAIAADTVNKIPLKTLNDIETWKYGSLMFDKKTIEWINEAIKSQEQQIPIEILLPSLFPSQQDTNIGKIDENPKPEGNIVTDATKKADIPKEAPVFYLKSILFFSDYNWSIWLNDKKISDKTEKKYENITIIQVTKNEAAGIWTNTQIDLIYPEWKNYFIDIGNGKFSSPARNIVINEATGDISFILKPNQSLTSKPLEIIEGPFKNTSTKSADTPEMITPGASLPIITDKSKALQNPLRKIIDTAEALKNIEVLKAILEQNAE